MGANSPPAAALFVCLVVSFGMVTRFASGTAGVKGGNSDSGGCENDKLQVRRGRESRRGTVFDWERGRARCGGLFVRMFGPFVCPHFSPFRAISPWEAIFKSFAIG